MKTFCKMTIHSTVEYWNSSKGGYLEVVCSALLFGKCAACDAQDGQGVDPHTDYITAGCSLTKAHQLLGAHTLGYIHTHTKHRHPKHLLTGGSAEVQAKLIAGWSRQVNLA